MNKNKLVLNNERLDDLGLKNLKIIQNPNFFCFGIDAVLISDFAKIKSNSTVVDLGTGNGIIPIHLAGKYKPKKIIGLEIQQASFDMAIRSIIYNNLEELIQIKLGDIRNAYEILKNEKVDAIVTNPPYTASNNGLTNLSYEKSIARHEILCNLEDIVKNSKSYTGKFLAQVLKK